MFVIIRILIGGMLFAANHIILHWLKKSNKRTWRLLLAIIVLVLTSFTFLLPLENMFVTFDSPKDVYEYVKLGKPNIKLIIENSETALVINEENGTYSYLIVPRTSMGWKLGVGADTKLVSSCLVDGIAVNIYQYKSTSNYYLSVIDTDGSGGKISDSANSEFIPLNVDTISTDTEVQAYVAYISELTPQYCIWIDGKKVSLE